ncbi:hypothetical protein BH24CHL10_BH24CHL10_12240 [soil metagenome]
MSRGALVPTVVFISDVCRLAINEPTKTWVPMPTPIPRMISTDWSFARHRKRRAIWKGSIEDLYGVRLRGHQPDVASLGAPRMFDPWSGANSHPAKESVGLRRDLTRATGR